MSFQKYEFETSFLFSIPNHYDVQYDIYKDSSGRRRVLITKINMIGNLNVSSRDVYEFTLNNNQGTVDSIVQAHFSEKYQP